MEIIVRKVDIDETIFLKEKYGDNISIKHNSNTDSIEVEIKKPINENNLFNKLDLFLSLISENKIHKLSDELYFDEANALIKGKNFSHRLTHREVLFLKKIIMKSHLQIQTIANS